MSELDLLLLVALAAIPLSAVLAPMAVGRWLAVAAYVVQLALLFMLTPGEPAGSTVSFQLLGNTDL